MEKQDPLGLSSVHNTSSSAPRKRFTTRGPPRSNDTRVYPGHGPVTTVDLEKLSNPFVGTEW